MTIENHTLGTPKKHLAAPSCLELLIESSKHQANILSGTEHPSRFWGSWASLVSFALEDPGSKHHNLKWEHSTMSIPDSNSSGLAAQSTLPWRPSVKMDGNVEANEKYRLQSYKYLFIQISHHGKISKIGWYSKVARAYEQKLYQSCPFPAHPCCKHLKLSKHLSNCLDWQTR